MVLLRQSRSNLPCNLYLDDCRTYDKPTVFIQPELHRTPLSDSRIITDCIQMTLDGEINEIHEPTESRMCVEILKKVRSFVKQNRTFIHALWDCNDDYDFKYFIKDMKPYNSSISDTLDITRENCDDDNEYE